MQKQQDGEATACCATDKRGVGSAGCLMCEGAAFICAHFYDSAPSGSFGTMSYMIRAVTCTLNCFPQEGELDCNVSQTRILSTHSSVILKGFILDQFSSGDDSHHLRISRQCIFIVFFFFLETRCISVTVFWPYEHLSMLDLFHHLLSVTGIHLVNLQ